MTKDADFKRLVRARMRKTGESYAAARAALTASKPDGAPDPVDVPAMRDFAPDPESTRVVSFRRLVERLTPSEYRGVVANSVRLSIAIEGEDLVVSMGTPPTFHARIPTERIAEATTVPDLGRFGSIGVHGRGDGWLVNTTRTGLVRLRLQDGASFEHNPTAAYKPDGVATQRPLRELTVSVDAPADFLAALGF